MYECAKGRETGSWLALWNWDCCVKMNGKFNILLCFFLLAKSMDTLGRASPRDVATIAVFGRVQCATVPPALYVSVRRASLLRRLQSHVSATRLLRLHQRLWCASVPSDQSLLARVPGRSVRGDGMPTVCSTLSCRAAWLLDAVRGDGVLVALQTGHQLPQTRLSRTVRATSL